MQGSVSAKITSSATSSSSPGRQITLIVWAIWAAGVRVVAAAPWKQWERRGPQKDKKWLLQVQSPSLHQSIIRGLLIEQPHPYKKLTTSTSNSSEVIWNGFAGCESASRLPRRSGAALFEGGSCPNQWMFVCSRGKERRSVFCFIRSSRNQQPCCMSTHAALLSASSVWTLSQQIDATVQK